MTLLPNPVYEAFFFNESGTVTISDRSTFDKSKRHLCGNTTDPSYYAFVIPIDFEKGTALDALGGNATNLFPGNPWATNFYHFNATIRHRKHTDQPPSLSKPIVAFGSRVGATLYLNLDYGFGFTPAHGRQLHKLVAYPRLPAHELGFRRTINISSPKQKRHEPAREFSSTTVSARQGEATD